ncbi:MAG: winged helix-turn-helix domain-containing protein [Candidatus Aenigmatarchaeota archaeon]
MVYDTITMLVAAGVGGVAFMSVMSYLFRRKHFSKKYVDIKEAPLQINNVLKDEIKRDIIRNLRKEKKYLTLIAKETNNSVAKTMYHLKELEKVDIIASMKLTREKFFLLTDRGMMCLKALYIYYPKNNFERIFNRLKYGQLNWKEGGRRVTRKKSNPFRMGI